MIYKPARAFLVTFYFIIVCIIKVNAQKPPIDFKAIKNWTKASEPQISNDGTYISYQRYQISGARDLTIKNVKSNWSEKFTNVGSCDFTTDSKKAIFLKGKDTLTLLDLSLHRINEILNVESYRLVKNQKSDWLIIKFNDTENTLRVSNLGLHKEMDLRQITTYQIANDHNLIYLESQKSIDGTPRLNLHIMSIPSFHDKLVWSYKSDQPGFSVEKIFYDNCQEQLIFLAGNSKEKAIWYYSQVDTNARVLIDNHNGNLKNGFKIDDLPFLGFDHGNSIGFDTKGTRFFFILSRTDTIKLIDTGVRVDVWNYKDAMLQSQQLYELKNNPLRTSKSSYLASYNLKTRNISNLTCPGESYSFIENDPDVKYIKTYQIPDGDGMEAYWNTDLKVKTILKTTTTGNEIKTNGVEFNVLSPTGHYLLMMKRRSDDVDCFVFDTKLKNTINVTSSIPYYIKINEDADSPGESKCGFSFGGWIKNEDGLLLYDKYDLWIVDPQGRRMPKNLTKNYGRSHQIIFRPIGYDRYNPIPIIDSVIILSAFDKNTKYNGFYSLNLRTGRLHCLTMGPYLYHFGDVGGMDPIKAKNSHTYLVERQSAVVSQNFFITKDFRTFSAVSDVHPERQYNWITSSVLNFKALDGQLITGVLYKPENFDARKKYPLIIKYYDKESDHANEFPEVEASGSDINIPWFVSHGYLVFTPDITYKIGHPGKSALNSVLGAGIALSKIKFVNPFKIGLSGHSWGAFQTDYILSHTNFFAAALSASGTADFVSDYGSIMKGGASKQFFSENGQLRIGASLGQRPELYIENSAIFRVGKIKTPILMMNNREDAVVPFSEGIEFFTVLRRLQKKAWMLQYDGEAHSLLDDLNKEDYTVRMTQFFDHYLKDAAPPKWMTEGIPAKLKGIETGYELDTSGKQP